MSLALTETQPGAKLTAGARQTLKKYGRVMDGLAEAFDTSEETLPKAIAVTWAGMVPTLQRASADEALTKAERDALFDSLWVLSALADYARLLDEAGRCESKGIRAFVAVGEQLEKLVNEVAMPGFYHMADLVDPEFVSSTETDQAAEPVAVDGGAGGE